MGRANRTSARSERSPFWNAPAELEPATAGPRSLALHFPTPHGGGFERAKQIKLNHEADRNYANQSGECPRGIAGDAWISCTVPATPPASPMADAASYITGRHIAVDGGFYISVQQRAPEPRSEETACPRSASLRGRGQIVVLERSGAKAVGARRGRDPGMRNQKRRRQRSVA